MICSDSGSSPGSGPGPGADRRPGSSSTAHDAGPGGDPTGAELEQAGWQRCFVADEPRLSEAVQTYEELGFEVLLRPVPPDDGQCNECMRQQPERFRIIYTRRPGSKEEQALQRREAGQGKHPGNLETMALRILLNGEPLEVPAGTTVAALLREQKEPAGHVLVEVNRIYVAPSRHEQMVLAEGDRVEVIWPAFGG